jgi:Protein of unknown function (DUF2516)
VELGLHAAVGDLGFVLFSTMGTVEQLIFFVLLGVKAFAFIDAATRPAGAFVAADKQTKPFWVIVLGLFFLVHVLFPGAINLFSLIGTVAAFVYLADARPALRAVGGGRR